MELLEKAYRLMLRAHGQQVRKTDGSPYIIHPLKVAKKLARQNFSDEVISAAMVHDVLEDTKVSAEELKQELGNKILQIILPLSEDKSLDWEERKEKYIEDVKNSSDETKAVSIADKIHNLEDLLSTHQNMGPGIWNKFNRPKDKKIWFEREMLKAFRKSWNHPMISEYENLLKQVEKLD